MAFFHPNLNQEKWNLLDKSRQVLNISAELNRANHWLVTTNEEYKKKSLERAFELIELSIADRKKWSPGARKELLRFRESLAEFYVQDTTSAISLKKYIQVLLNLNPISAQVQL